MTFFQFPGHYKLYKMFAIFMCLSWILFDILNGNKAYIALVDISCCSETRFIIFVESIDAL